MSKRIDFKVTSVASEQFGGADECRKFAQVSVKDAMLKPPLKSRLIELDEQC